VKRWKVDRQRVVQAILGDKKALDELTRQCRPMVRQFVSQWVDDRDEAEDLTQEVLMRATEQIHKLRNPDSFERWLLGIAKNCCKMWLRSRALEWRKGVVSLQGYFGTDPPEDLFYWHRWEKRQVIEGWLSTLPSRWAEALRLRFLNGYSEREIAQQMGVPITTVVNDIHRAKQKLKEAIGMTKQKLHEVKTTIRKELPVKEKLPIVIYGGHMEWQWEIQSSDNGVVRMEVTITALGRTEQEAKRQQKRIAVQLQQVDKLSFTEPFEFFPFVGKALRGVTTGRKGKPQPFYANHEGMWVGYMKMLSDLAPEPLPTKGAMSKGCFLVVVADNGLKGLEVPVRLLPKDSPTPYPWHFAYSKDDEHRVFGPGVLVKAKLSIPQELPLLAVIEGEISLADYAPESQEIPAIFVGGYGAVKFNRVKGNFSVLGDMGISEARELDGHLTWQMRACLSGVDWGREPIQRVAIPTSLFEDVSGDLDIEVRQARLVFKGVKGNLKVLNEFGKTELWLTNPEASKGRYELMSNSGEIAIFLTPQVEKAMRIHLLTECGAIDRSKWRRERLEIYNTPREIFVGTVPKREDANLKVLNRAGNIFVAYTNGQQK
jgi:RNA polymerase sigma-70 factor (ECF subfamily)